MRQLRIHRIEILNFRGVKELEWDVTDDCVCLIGPGDSTKTTILDAIELALTPGYPAFYDTDFFNAETSEPIQISITVGDLPESFLHENVFGLFLRGWSKFGKLNDEPKGGDELVITIKLRVDDSLEPEWCVFTDRNPTGVGLRRKYREAFGISRMGSYFDYHLRWGRRSLLTQLTDNVDNLGSNLTSISRAIIDQLDTDKIPEELSKTSEYVEDLTKQLGVKSMKGYHPHLDHKSISIGEGSVILFDGPVPVRQAGLGTRRLVIMALQREMMKSGGIAIIDEIEYGLEPHRIRHLLRLVQSDIRKARGSSPPKKTGQVFISTHSSTAVVELNTNNLNIVRNVDGLTTIQCIDKSLQDIVRREPEAFLGRKVIVCEGKTELGLVWHLDEWWTEEQKRLPFACTGAVPVHGEGSNGPSIALKFNRLGYNVAWLADSDRGYNPSATELKEEGVEVLQWDGDVSTEERVCKDLPWSGIKDLFKAANQEWKNLTRKALTEISDAKLDDLDEDIDTWLGYTTQEKIRSLISKLAKEQKWYKRPDLGKGLGLIVTKYLAQIPESDLAIKLKQLRDWIDGDV